MKGERAPRNRTLQLTKEEATFYRQHFVTGSSLKLSGVSFIDSTINDDLITVLPLLPDEFADLIIIDPPYNLTKDFHGNKFTARTQDEYIIYLRQWLPLVVKKLKPTGSLYLCGIDVTTL